MHYPSRSNPQTEKQYILRNTWVKSHNQIALVQQNNHLKLLIGFAYLRKLQWFDKKKIK